VLVEHEIAAQQPSLPSGQSLVDPPAVPFDHQRSAQLDAQRGRGWSRSVGHAKILPTIHG